MVEIEETPTAETSPPAKIPTSAAREEEVYNSDAYETASETELNDAEEEQSGDSCSRNDTVSNGGDVGKVEQKQPPNSNQDEKEALAQANNAKLEGNTLFKEGLYEEALMKYELALQTAPDGQPSIEIRSICLANRAACFSKLGKFEETIKECTKALELNPKYIKVLLRRAEAREKVEQYEEAIADATQILELDPSQGEARRAIFRLKPLADEKREKLKEEMMGKLKEMGNSLLGHFGMSVDNFKAIKDPNTGSYSIKFQN